MAYTVHALGNVPTFENWLFKAAAQKATTWPKGALGGDSRSIYSEKTILEYNPYPPEKGLVE